MTATNQDPFSSLIPPSSLSTVLYTVNGSSGRSSPLERVVNTGSLKGRSGGRSDILGSSKG